MNNIIELLDAIPKELLARQYKKEQLMKKFEQFGGEIVIYGHGNLGCELHRALENGGLTVKYFLDANKPTDLNQKNINLRDANKYLTSDAIIIVALYNVYLEYPFILYNLQSFGFQNILSVLDLRVWPELFQAGHIHSTLSWDIEHIPSDQVCSAYSLMEDDLSKKVYSELLKFFIMDHKAELTLCPIENQYMPDDTYLSTGNDCIVDCGAYDGDTMRAFLSALGTWQSYTAIDADPYNIEKVKKSIQQDIPAQLQGVTQAIHAAVSNEWGNISFCAGNRTASHVILEGEENQQTVSVPVVKLDDVIQGPVTLLKMDVEGFELRALQGAERLILANQPLLAICGYHRQADLWEIPLYMKNLLPNHRILLRNYVGIIEYVFYAIPEDRVLP